MDIIFTLDKRPNKKKYDCPGCGNKRTFTRYIHIETLEDLAEGTGKCDRLYNCGYHYTPKQFFSDNKGLISPYYRAKNLTDNARLIENQVTSFIEKGFFDSSMQTFDTGANHFYKFITDCFGRYAAENVCRRYNVGNSTNWQGANIFWQVDIEQKIRTGKIMLYNENTGKRVKEPYNHVNWVHQVMAKKGIIKDFHLKQCFFGEHILKYETTEPIAIVESEKTAIICYLFMPEYIWLAAGQANGLKIDKCRSLKGRKVVLFPDLKMFDTWNEKAKQIRFNLGLNITVSDTLEKIVLPEDLNCGFDLADYLLQSNAIGQAMHENGGTMEEFLLNNNGLWEDSVKK